MVDSVNIKLDDGLYGNITTKQTTIYLSGGMSNYPDHNFPAFEAATKDLRARGFKVISPHENDHGSHDKSWLYYMKLDIVSVANSDVIVVLDGWEKSKGANVEVTLGRGLGYPILKYPDLTPIKFHTEDWEENPLEVANRLVDGDRGSFYGHPLDDMGRTAKMWSGLLGIEVSAEQVAMCMMMVKMSRQMNKSKKDNIDDLGGYLKCLWLIIQERKRREEQKL